MLQKIPNETLYMYNTCTCIWIDYNEHLSIIFRDLTRSEVTVCVYETPF